MLFQSGSTREVLLHTYRLYARCVRFLPGPAVFVNSMPKAGTHLLTSLLTEGPKLMLAGRHIRQWQVNRLAAGEADRRHNRFEFDPNAFRALLARIHPGQIVTAHLPWQPEIPAILNERGFAVLYMIRDPRDVLVSQLHYIKGLARHPLHDWLSNSFQDDHARLLALINGNEDAGAYLAPISRRLEEIAPWLSADGSRLVRFEALAAGEPEQRLHAYRQIFEHAGRRLETAQLEAIRRRMQHKKSFTFRKGATGDWRAHFDESHKEAFKRLAGDMLLAMGYEERRDW